MHHRLHRHHALISTPRPPPLSPPSPTVATLVGAKKKPRYGEVMGAAAAECAAVFCCCPCAVLDLLVLTVVRLPAGIFRRAIRRRRRRRMMRLKAGLTGGDGKINGGEGDHDVAGGGIRTLEEVMKASPAVEMEMKEREMWARFHAGGFWRSPSQQERD